MRAQLKEGASFANTLSVAYRIVATVPDGINLSPQARMPRESHCHEDPHFQGPGEGPTTVAKGAWEESSGHK